MKPSPHSVPVRILRILPAALVAGLLSGPVLAATITVDVANDEHSDNGNCSLREAIIAANTDTDYYGCVGTGAYGTDTIAFAIPGAGPHIIDVATALPIIATPMHILGYSQTGSSQNSAPVGSNAVIQVGIANAAAVSTGLQFDGGADGSSLSGLRITGFDSVGVLLNGATGLDNVTIAGNFIGTDGVSDLGNYYGISLINDTASVVIGGAALGDRNVIAGGHTAIKSTGSGAQAIAINNNLIGTGADGTTPLPSQYGIDISGGVNHVISGNVIGAGVHGIVISNDVTVTRITGNAIGVGADGTSFIAGTGHGVWLVSWSLGLPQNNDVGGVNEGDGNVIANWGGDGVRLSRMNDTFSFNHGNSILGNSIYGNGGLGIELMLSEGGSPFAESVGVTPNDPGDGDDGNNRLQNYPVITSAVTDGGSTSVSFTLDSAGTGFRIEVFSSPTCDASGHGEGQVFLGGANFVSLDGSLDDTWSLLPATTAGHFITMTATNTSTGDTSEFSACQAVTFSGPSGPPTTPPVPVPVMSLPALAATALLLMLGGRLARRRRL